MHSELRQDHQYRVDGEIGIANAAAYRTSKGAVGQLTISLAAERAPLGIHVNAILPGWFKTELTEKLFEDDTWRSRAMARIPLGQAGDPKDVGNLALVLASKRSDYLYGEMIRLDGGALAW